jgi:hypothetical protein
MNKLPCKDFDYNYISSYNKGVKGENPVGIFPLKY